MVAINDWDFQRANARDGWERELFEGAEFDAQAANVLQPESVLIEASATAGNWLVTHNTENLVGDLPGWGLVTSGTGWNLYKSGAQSAPESPKPAQQKGLPGCKH